MSKSDRIRSWLKTGRAITSVEALVLILAQAGLIIRTSRGYALTSKGSRHIPVAPPVMPAMRPYRPPVAAPRRPGSMAFLAAPSVYSGSARA